jgi:hypothetical protein
MAKPHFWTAKEMALLGTQTDKEVAQQIGVSPATVYVKRSKLGIPAHNGRPHFMCRWGTTELAMLGRFPDSEIAELTSRSLNEVVNKRKSLGIKPLTR